MSLVVYIFRLFFSPCFLVASGRRLASQGSKIGGGQRGFSVLEMVVAVGTFGILATAAGVGLGRMAPQFDLDNGARMITMGLNQARTLAITRGHVVEVTFGDSTFEITDTEEEEVVATEQLPAHITMTSSSVASFTPLGTVDDPLVVTLSNGGEHNRIVRISLTGEVQVGEALQ